LTRSKRRGDRGFTLVELTVAALLVVTVAAGVLATLINAAQAIRPANHVAHYLAMQTFERLHEAVRQDWWPLGGFPLSVGGPYPDAAPVMDGVPYTRTYQVFSETNGDGIEDYRRVRVTVTWPD
jgi:type II secretory pathway pseudopilin PulG